MDKGLVETTKKEEGIFVWPPKVYSRKESEERAGGGSVGGGTSAGTQLEDRGGRGKGRGGWGDGRGGGGVELRT